MQTLKNVQEFHHEPQFIYQERDGTNRTMCCTTVLRNAEKKQPEVTHYPGKAARPGIAEK
jgi:hypothetical protein